MQNQKSYCENWNGEKNNNILVERLIPMPSHHCIGNQSPSFFAPLAVWRVVIGLSSISKGEALCGCRALRDDTCPCFGLSYNPVRSLCCCRWKKIGMLQVYRAGKLVIHQLQNFFFRSSHSPRHSFSLKLSVTIFFVPKCSPFSPWSPSFSWTSFTWLLVLSV